MKRICAVAMLAAGMTGATYAHAVLNNTEGTAGNYYTAEMRPTHGCGTSPTHTLKVQLPEGSERVTIRQKDGWKIETVMRKRATPRVAHNITYTEEVAEIIWSGGKLEADKYDVFEFRLVLPDRPGENVFFKTVQLCDNGGSERWTEIPKDGGNPLRAGLEFPAPFVHLNDGPKAPKF